MMEELGNQPFLFVVLIIYFMFTFKKIKKPPFYLYCDFKLFLFVDTF